jgi:hypothetical protein
MDRSATEKKGLGVRKDAGFNFGSRTWKGPVSCSQLLIIPGRLTSSNTFILEKDFHNLTHKKVKHQFTDGLLRTVIPLPRANNQPHRQ